MFWQRVQVVILAAAGVAARSFAAPPSSAPTTASVDAQAREVISQLACENFRDRQNASLRVNNLGGESLPLLEAALASPNLDPEARERLEAAIVFVKPRAKYEGARKARLTWEARQFHEAYAKGGHTGPSWDADVDAAVDAFLQLGIGQRGAITGSRQATLDALRRAFDHGCGDPLVYSIEYVLAGDVRATHWPPPKDNLYHEPPWTYLTSIRSSASPYVKFVISLGALHHRETGGPANYWAADSQLPGILALPDVPPGIVGEMGVAILGSGERDNELQGCGGFQYTLAKAAPGYEAGLWKAMWLLDVADARRRGTGESVADELAEARKLLAGCWELDPTDPRAPTQMITALAIDGGTREDAEAWYARAVALDPDDSAAARRMVRFLHDHPSNPDDRSADVLQFARQCLATRNWRGGMAQVLADAHRLVADDAPNRAEYLARPEVWDDLHRVYDGWVLNYPRDVAARSQFAKLAADCGQWGVAHEQFDSLGDEPDLRPFVSRATYDYVRKKAARLAAAQPPAP